MMNPLLSPLIFLIAMVLAELYVMIGVGEVIGAGWTVFLVVFTAVFGGLLVRHQGMSAFMRAQQSMARGEAPELEMLEGVALFLGGMLLLIPGFLSDVVGLLMLLPPLRRVVIRWILSHRGPRPPGGGDTPGPRTIEGEFWRDK